MDNIISLIEKIGKGRLKSKEALEKLKDPVDSQTNQKETSIKVNINQGNASSNVKQFLTKKISDKIGISESDIDSSVNFLELGLDSVSLIQMSEEIENELNVKLYPTLFFEYQNLDSLSDYFNNTFKTELSAFFQTTESVDNSQSKKSQNKQIYANTNINAEIVTYLKKIISNKINVDENDVDTEEQFLEIGLDSVTLIQLSEEIENNFQIKLYPTLFFEYQNVKVLSDYFAENFSAEMRNYFNINEQIIDSNETTENTRVSSEIVSEEKSQSNNENNDSIDYIDFIDNLDSYDGSKKFDSSENKVYSKSIQNNVTDIAIVGFDGVFPGSPDLDSYWRNLEEGKDLIQEIPQDRWDWNNYYGDPVKEANKTFAKWGGFVDNIDKFDAKFFSISPRDAELMDPQQRIFLNTVWKAIEQSGYKASDLSKVSTGLFVGVSTNDYSELMVENQIDIEAQTSIGTVHSILPNRVSFLLNLNGPSEAVDTACSSSLVAMNRAIMAIQSGECDVAIAGGVNALLHPKLFLSFSKAGMLSSDGRCKTFDKSANGYVRGEGVGAVILKPLEKAIEDNDTIYATVKSSAVNHGGHANSLTAPNPNAQAALLMNAYQKANVDPSTISYIEAHGTGTSLGDPIEITGLKKAFSTLQNNNSNTNVAKPYCGIGSVKTNIGHLEAAAGIAGVIKVLLSMKNKKLPGNIHLKEVNPYIDVNSSPFYFVKETKNWESIKDSNGNQVPRRAGISSFGFGGANAHVLLEEFENNKTKYQDDKSNYIFTLSAKSKEQLTDYCNLLINYLNNNKESNLRDIAYTLQVGRESLEERVAIVSSSRDDLISKLQQFTSGKSNIAKLYSGNIKSSQENIGSILEDLKDEKYLRNIIENNNLEKLANLFITGVNLDWSELYAGLEIQRIALPVYPFKQERYWFDKNNKKEKTLEQLSPVIDKNISTFWDHSFSKTLTGNEFYLKDHVISGHKLLPGVAYLEMAVVGAELFGENSIEKVTDVKWISPVAHADESQEVKLNLYASRDHVNYEIYTEQAENREIHSQGKLYYNESNEEKSLEKLDVKKLISSCKKQYNKEELYNDFKSLGFEYGYTFQPIAELNYNDKLAVSKLELAQNLTDSFSDFILHPSIMDGALQTVIKLDSNAAEGVIYLPFSLGEITLYQSIEQNVYVVAETVKSDSTFNSFNITLVNEEGTVLAKIKDFTAKAAKISSFSKMIQLKKESQKTFAAAQEVKPVEAVVSSASVVEVQDSVNIKEELTAKNKTSLIEIVSSLLKVDKESIDLDEELSNYGFDSIGFTDFANTINEKFSLNVTPAIFFEHPTLNSFNDYLCSEYESNLIKAHKIEATVSKVSKQEEVAVVTSTVSEEISSEQVVDKIKNDLALFVCEILKVDKESIDADEDLSNYGFDSIGFTNFSEKINEKYNLKITPAIFFEHSSLESFATYLSEEYADVFNKYYKVSASTKEVVVEPVTVKNTIAKQVKPFRKLPTKSFSANAEPIAVVGLSCVMPNSANSDEFWQNLVSGKDSIQEIPNDRWDWNKYYGDPAKEANKTFAKWGGFIDNIDKFDARFFSISPKEAELMDPQQRIFLQTVWKAIEDSGSKPADLSKVKTGLFVGVSGHDYDDLLKENGVDVEAYTSTGMVHSILANRISYLMNFNGPSEAIDTACSSSLIAIHRAVMSIQNGESDVAIAGGVNALLHPKLFLSFSKAGMLSPDGRCKTFDKSANGYVRGEGAGAIILKPLSKAIKDNDHIYGTINGTAVNHGGHVNTMTAPNPNAQSALIIDAFEKSDFKPSTVSYIEAHGTGTSLGDPIEINGLKKAFSTMYKNNNEEFDGKPYCAIGSVKTNIGHLETAAGIAGVIKVLLSMKNKKLPGNIHLNEVNPYIDVNSSPFYFVKETKDWENIKDSNGNKIPRRAGISSFGFGGANAHVVLEEFENKQTKYNDDNNYIFTLSAKSQEQLNDYCNLLINYLNNDKESNLRDIAYTLQVGRESLEERVAIVSSNRDDLITKLQQFASGKSNVNQVYSGNIKGNKKSVDLVIDGSEGENYLKTIIKNHISNKNLEKLANLWITGVSLDWQILYSKLEVKKVSLPAYPFKQERYWFDKNNKKEKTLEQLSPVIDKNISTFWDHSFSKTLTGNEFYLKDHVISGHKLLPGVAYLEMAVVGAQLFGENNIEKVTDVKWISPVAHADENQEVKLNLYASRDHVNYEIYTEQTAENREIHSQGKLYYNESNEEKALEKLDVKKLISSCKKHYNKEELYENIKSLGFEYGYTFQPIAELNYTDKLAVSKLELAQNLTDSFGDFILHPSIMDGALQTVIKLDSNAAEGVIYLPFSLGEITLYQSIEQNVYVVAETVKSDSTFNSFNITLVNEEGTVLAKIKDFTAKAAKISSFSKMIQLKKESQKTAVVAQEVKPVETVVSSASVVEVQDTVNIKEELTAKNKTSLIEIVSSLLKVDKESIDLDEELSNYGFDSIGFTDFANTINEKFSLNVTPAIFFEHPTLNSFNDYLCSEYESNLIKAHKIEATVSKVSKQEEVAVVTSTVSEEISSEQVVDKIKNDLALFVCEILKVDKESIDADEDLSNYGFDSIGFTNFSEKINEKYNLKITPAIFFEHSSLESFATYLSEEYSDVFNKYYKVSASAKEVVVEPVTVKATTAKQDKPFRKLPTKSFSTNAEPIAVVGLSCVMPNSDDSDQFWQNLVSGQDLVSEVPGARWDWKEYFGDPLKERNKTNSKWGGFINDIDKFDSRFFSISPKEAELMDPQQRIFLQTVWKAIEDSGSKPADLSKVKTGLFVGVSGHDYDDLLKDHRIDTEAYTTTGMVHSVLANRISYLMNFNGPSEAVDTACSSSLIAIHRAVMSIQNGESDVAIAGGVNALLHPRIFVSFSKAGMLSPDGRCKTFDKAANGYVRGEGAGAIILKPLSKAIKDNDHIYGTINGTAVNHGGHVNTMTAPNPNAQSALIIDAFEKSDFKPSTVSYIEAHGTGTSLGDPIEINGLKKAFSTMYKNNNEEFDGKPYCAIGSVKTNIGHLETAAGIAGVIKVLLSMKNKKLPGNIHLNEVNPYIDVNSSPFYFVKETKEWNCLTDSNGNQIPRRAGVSSFGFGGANAHVTVEEYNDKINEETISGDYIFTVSAKNEDVLNEYILNYLNFFKSANKLNLCNLAYTSQVGREAMQCRLAIVVSSIDELSDKLEKCYNGEFTDDAVYKNIVQKNNKKRDSILEDEEGKEYIANIIKNKKIKKVASLWTEGVEVDWNLLYTSKPVKISLPTYPFAKDRCWIPEQDNNNVLSTGKSNNIHPLIAENSSTLMEQSYTSYFNGSEFYLRDHNVASDRVLPGVAYLEMARAAGEMAAQSKVTRISNAIWAKPIIANNSVKTIKTTINPSNDRVDYEIFSIENNEKNLHAQGKLYFENIVNDDLSFNIEEIKSRAVKFIKKDDCYKLFQSKKLNYGKCFQPITELFSNEKEVLSCLELPSELNDSFNDFVLHPSIMDGALQTAMGIVGQDNDSATFLPFSLKNLIIKESLTSKLYVYVKLNDKAASKNKDFYKFNIYILDVNGNVLIEFNDFTSRKFEITGEVTKAPAGITKPQSMPQVKIEKHAPVNVDSVPQTMYFTANWQENMLTPGVNKKEITGISLVFDQNDKLSKNIKKYLSEGSNIVYVKFSNTYKKTDNNHYEININNYENYVTLFKELKENNLFPENIIVNKLATKYTTSKIEENLNNSILSIFKISKSLIESRTKQKLNLYYFYKNNNVYNAAVSGLAKTIIQENPAMNYKAIGVDADVNNEKLIEMFLDEKTSDDKNIYDIKYQNDKRYIKKFTETSKSVNGESLFKENGVYLITGGAGGLGLLFAEYLAKSYKAKLILTGRSDLNDSKQSKIKNIESLGSEVMYVKGSITENKDVKELVKTAKEKFGKINGVIHSAGLIKDSFIVKKSEEDFKQVIAPKIYGTLNLDNALKDEELDFFMLFSSIAAAIGNAGQSDYSYSNSFLDCFANSRNMQVSNNERKGHTVSINWPLWKNGGMHVDEKIEKFIEKKMGLIPLGTEDGIKAFEDVLKLGNDQMLIVAGYRKRVGELNGVEIIATENSEISNVNSGESKTEITEENNPNLNVNDSFVSKVEQDVVNMFSELLKVDASDIDIDAEVVEYGVDSIMMMTIMNRVEEMYGETIEPNVLTEYPTIKAFVSYLIDNNIVKVEQAQETKTQNAVAAKSVASHEIKTEIVSTEADASQVENDLLKMFSELLKVEETDIDREVEVVEYGVDSIMMMTIMNRVEELYGETIEPNVLTEYPTIKEFAQYLIDNNIVKHLNVSSTEVNNVEENNNIETQTVVTDNSFTEPNLSNRFNNKLSFVNNVSSSSNVQRDNRIAIVGVACRFPGSNNIDSFWESIKNEVSSIIEVPADRWNINDFYSADKSAPNKSYSKWAGFLSGIDLFDANFFGIPDDEALTLDPQHRIALELSQELLDNAGYSKEELSKTNTGVYLGAGQNNYVQSNQYNIPESLQKKMIVNTIQNMMAARIADYYNLRGPAQTIDTACSSSLVAIHQACQAIRNGEIDNAIVGGVELLIDPFPHVGFSKSGALSDEDRSYVFDEKAKGFVLGEGAGLVLIKSYQEAINNGDQILAVISGSAVNNDGHTMGLTVPNLDGQKNVIKQAVENAGVNPESISYLEAHGTGTLLGDPIEVKAASQVYSEYTNNKQYCAIGSIKTNIGHLLHAAGVASLVKVIMAIKNKAIPASLNCSKPHPRFKFEQTPFFPVTKTIDWQPADNIRRAGISSFGFGGTNCHIIVEEFLGEKVSEYVQKKMPLPVTKFNRKRYWIGKDVKEFVSSDIDINSSFYLELMDNLQNGNINVMQAIELIRLSEN